MYPRTLSLGVTIMLLGVCSHVHASLISLKATDAGFVTEKGGSAKGDGTVVPSATYNYSVGFELHYEDGALGSPVAPMLRKNYFVFDLTGVSTPIISATLKVYAGKLESVDPTEVFKLFDTTDPTGALADIDALLAGHAVGSSEFDEASDPLVKDVAPALYGKLADGPFELAAVTISSADDMTTLAITFTPDGVSYLNLFLGARVVLGGVVPTVDPASGSPQQPFGLTGPDIPGGDPTTPVLELSTSAVPEPSAFWMALFGCSGMVLFGIRRSAGA